MRASCCPTVLRTGTGHQLDNLADMFRSIASTFAQTAKLGELQLEQYIQAEKQRLLSGEGKSLLLLPWEAHPFKGEDWVADMDPVVIFETNGRTTFGSVCKLGCCTEMRLTPTGHRFIRLRADVLPDEIASVAGLRRLPPNKTAAVLTAVSRKHCRRTKHLALQPMPPTQRQ